MKRISLFVKILAVAVLVAGAPAARAQGVVTKAVTNGTFGALFGKDASHVVSAFVNRGPDASGQTVTRLFFEIDEPSPTVNGGFTTVLFGSGTIPSSDLQDNGLGKLSLDTDISSNASFTTFSCPNPLPATPPFCTVVPNSGRVSMTLSHGSMPTTQTTGQWTWTWGNMIVTQIGTQEVSPATGQGSVVGVLFPADASGTIGVNHDVFVVVQQGP